jgi:hypothetical protein
MLPLLVLVLVLALPILALETLVCTLCRCFEYSPDMDMYTLENGVLMVEPICFIGVVFFVFVFAYLFCFLNVINIFLKIIHYMQCIRTGSFLQCDDDCGGAAERCWRCRPRWLDSVVARPECRQLNVPFFVR